MKNILNQLIMIPSVSGREQEIGRRIMEMVKDYADEVYTDALDNVITVKKSGREGAKKIMMAAHMDEIGFIVTKIEDEGFLRVSQIGGINWTAVAYGEILFENGVRGVLVPEGRVYPNEFTGTKMYIDIGAKDKEDAAKSVPVGTSGTLAPKIIDLLNNNIAATKLDDKIACAVLIQALMNLKGVKCEQDLYFVFTTQEEVGIRGAKTSAYSIMPDYSIAVDVTGTGDTIKCSPMDTKIGAGAAIKIKDSSVICHRTIISALESAAKENNIKYQFEILDFGGTDTANMQSAGAGSIAGAISIPSRYIHSGVETCSMDDVAACADLLTAVLKGGF